jgi:hypothetical protein
MVAYRIFSRLSFFLYGPTKSVPDTKPKPYLALRAAPWGRPGCRRW